MDKIIEKSDLNINSWLISWGLMRGEYHDGVFKITIRTVLQQLLVFSLSLFQLVKWLILIFNAEDSDLSHYLGEWAHYLGPKLIVDTIVILEPVNSLSLIFYFGSTSNPKLLYWLDLMHFDVEKRCFDKMDLNEKDSKKLMVQFALASWALKRIIVFLDSITFIVIYVSFFFFTNDYHIYYFISIALFTADVWYLSFHWFGLVMVFYQVNNSFKFVQIN